VGTSYTTRKDSFNHKIEKEGTDSGVCHNCGKRRLGGEGTECNKRRGEVPISKTKWSRGFTQDPRSAVISVLRRTDGEGKEWPECGETRQPNVHSVIG